MLSRIFKNSDRLIFVILPFLGLIVWIFSFFVLGYSKTGFSSSLVLPFLPGNSVNLFVLKVLNLLFTLGGAFLLNYLIQYHEVIERQNFLPSFIYLLLCAMLNIQEVLHPLLVANVLVLAAFFKVFGAYRSDSALSIAFDSSFILSCAALVYWPLLLLLPVGLVALMILKTLKFRELLLVIIGLALPFALTATLLWIFNVEPSFWKQSFSGAFRSFHLPVWEKGSFLVNTAVILLFLLSFIGLMSGGFGSKVKSQKIKYVLLWLLVPGALAIFFSSGSPVFIGIGAIIPLSLFIGDYLGNIKKPLLADFLLLVFIAAFIFSNLQAARIL